MCLFPAAPAHSVPSQPIPTAQSVSSSPSVPVEEPALVVDLSEIPDGTLSKINVFYYLFCYDHHSLTIDDSHLSVLVTALSTMYQWFSLGIHLGVSYSKLKVIEGNQRGQIEMCKIDMLAMWLQGPEEKRNKKFLEKALQRLDNIHTSVSVIAMILYWKDYRYIVIEFYRIYFNKVNLFLSLYHISDR